MRKPSAGAFKGAAWVALYLAAPPPQGGEGLIGRAREDHCFGFRRANIFRRYQADLGLLIAALGAQQRHPLGAVGVGHG